MGYTIPNEAGSFQDPNTSLFEQHEPDTVDFAIIAAGFDETGVRSGCVVTESGPTAMTVEVASGTVVVAAAEATVTSGQLVIGAADATNPRFDLVVVNNSGVKSVVAGTPAANPVFPAIPANSAVIATVYIPATDTAITNAQIIDKRMIVRADALSGSLFNVLNYGAVGDGVADDTTECQDALDAANTAGGGTVYFPAGTYKTSAELVVYANTLVRGEGVATIVRQITTATNGFRFNTGDNRMAVRNMNIQSDVAKALAAIRLNNNKECFVADVYIDGRTQQSDRWRYGIQIEDSGSGNSNWLFFQNFYIQSIHQDTDSAGIFINRDQGGWGFNFLGGIVQTEKDTSDTDYTTPGYCGLWIKAVDGCHFSDIEFIDFAFPCILESVSLSAALVEIITNTKFKSISFETAASGNPAVHIRTNGGVTAGGIISAVGFWGCNFFGINTNTSGLVIDAEDGTPGDVIQGLLFSDCSFTGGGTGNSVTVSRTGGSGATVARINFENCDFNTATDGVEINAGVSIVKVANSDFRSVLTNGVDINGSDAKKVTIIGNDFDSSVGTPIDLGGYSGSKDDIVSEGNTPDHDDVNFSPGVRAGKTASQTGIATGTRTKISWNSVATSHRYDDPLGLMFDNANDRLIARKAGKYLIQTNINWGAQTTDLGTYRIIWLQKNGAGDVAVQAVPPINNGAVGTISYLAATVEMADGDYIEVDVQHDRTSAQSSSVLTADGTWFSMKRVGP